MQRVLLAKLAVLSHFQSLFDLLFVSRCPISDPFALGAFEFDDVFARHIILET